MTSREKGMLVVLLLGGLGAGGFMLFEKIQSMSMPLLPGKPSSQIIQQVQNSLSSASLNPARVTAAISAQTPLLRNFLQPMPRWLEESNKVKTKKHDDLQYTGYLKGNARALAIIGNSEYAVGDAVEGTTLVVKAISAENVLLSSGEGEDTELPYKGEELSL